MSENLTVRRLERGDIDAVRRMNALFGRAFGDPDSYGAVKPSDAYFERVLAKPDIIALAAEAEGRMAGALVAYVLDKLEQERSEIYIYDLAVAEELRRQGIATALIARLKEIAAEIGAWVIYVQADHGDHPAMALYSKLGEREDVLHFDIPPAIIR